MFERRSMASSKLALNYLEPLSKPVWDNIQFRALSVTTPSR
jgi:hypothetical protein